MVDDVVRTLGFLCMGSRFRRIGERLQADTQQIIEEYGIAIQAAQYPFLAALDRAGPLTIGELAQAVGITQPGATRTVSQLLELGLVDMQAAPDDQRRRLISLSRKGQELVDYSKQSVWPRISAAVADLCGDLNGPILAQLAAIEDRLAEAALVRRAAKEETT
ncbi:MarR family transcriptional regulator [Rhizobium sp. SEMIA 4085]|uniref:MarR family transcriptional regulator protein n=1 Tax=Rhizobium gallicum bv. gallicum R602sp TaxID=1041138 RepID=A0A0B4X5R5_9HYPH|nr:MarR family transcriptional regulator [Rhizobium gallicum]AJD42025.1 MarR family transcriptional regulator protein [Rhizobium gallicum bv. gallicum R602sp]NNH31213.1 MarR family transcriptional regulator [Rhizobium sp. SEMIA 4085]TDW26815.1 MarR family protein [Rhizobium azibense]